MGLPAKRITRQATTELKAQYFRDPLPPCKGPKLPAFAHHDEPIQWLSRLGSDDDDDTSDDFWGPSPLTYVFKVKIASQVYALKVFDFFHVEYKKSFWAPVMPETYSVEKIGFHTDPFYAECRAYGRIMETEAENTKPLPICVPCYGYIMLSDADRAILEQRFHLRFDDLHPYKTPLRAIVKQYAGSDPGITNKTLKNTKQLIQRMNKMKIYNRDIRLDNFRNGLLIDFDCSWTEPHCFIQHMPLPRLISRNKKSDESAFGQMLKAHGLDTRYSFSPNFKYITKLRKRARKG